MSLPPTVLAAAVAEGSSQAGLPSGATTGSVRGGFGGGRRGSAGCSGRGWSCRRAGGADNAAAGRAVPVRYGVAEAFSDSDGPVARLIQSVEHVPSQVVSGLVMDVVCDGQELVCSGIAAAQCVREPVLCILLELGGCIVVVVGVEVKVGHVVTQFPHIRLAPGCSGAARVWRTHVCREETEDVPQSHLVLPHLVFTLPP